MTDQNRTNSTPNRADRAGAGAHEAAANADAIKAAADRNADIVGEAGLSATPSGSGTEGGVRRPRPDAAAQDPHDAAIQDRVRADSEANRESARRVEASTPPDVRDRTVHEIVDDAEARARR